jgi:hypothetical protein
MQHYFMEPANGLHMDPLPRTLSQLDSYTAMAKSKIDFYKSQRQYLKKRGQLNQAVPSIVRFYRMYFFTKY